MNSKSRISSILETTCLDVSITGMPNFDLSQVEGNGVFDVELPTSLRLGHLAEYIIARFFEFSLNYDLLFESLQLVENKQTIGEIDFILKDLNVNRVIHVELAYKFYLLDPKLSQYSIKNWVGPNRNDTLKNKLDKLKKKQFPLLHHPVTKSNLQGIPVEEVSQALCLLVNLYVPLGYEGGLNPLFQKGVKGYYLDFETLIKQHKPNMSYCLPTKKEWGINPEENGLWFDFDRVLESIKTSLHEKQSVLIWQKQHDKMTEFFCVWW